MLLQTARKGELAMAQSRAVSPVILVVDDEAVLRMLTADFFQDAGYDVIEAASGAVALDLLAERSDVVAVVTDVQMPGEPDGFELSRMVRARSPYCAVIVTSGRELPRPGDLAARARYVTKPYRGEDLVRMVNDMLGR